MILFANKQALYADPTHLLSWISDEDCARIYTSLAMFVGEVIRPACATNLIEQGGVRAGLNLPVGERIVSMPGNQLSIGHIASVQILSPSARFSLLSVMASSISGTSKFGSRLCRRLALLFCAALVGVSASAKGMIRSLIRFCGHQRRRSIHRAHAPDDSYGMAW